MEYSTRPNRSDAHLDAKAAAEIEAATKHYFEEAAPKRHNKPQRSEYSSTYVDDLSAGEDQPIPENLQFKNLEKDTQKVVPDGSEVVEEFIETEYYTDLNCIDKQHHTTGTGFIKVDHANEKSFSIVSDGATESHASSRGNPATNDWIPATANTVDFVTGKPNRINGRFPRPTIYASENDTLLVKVINHVGCKMSIHWHGIRQHRTGWVDGPAYITQCPIQQGQSYVYNFTLSGQRGTLLWLRATIHGAIVTLPKLGMLYPFPIPYEEVVVILDEWWKSDIEDVINQAMDLGMAPNVSDAYTINGHPGPRDNCFGQGIHVRS